MKTFKEFISDISEAVGDPLSSRNVIPLNKETERNLRSTMTPAGPPRMNVGGAKKQSGKPEQKDKFLRRMIGNTILSPL